MPDTTTTPNMNLPVPVPSTAPGPQWANNVVADMYAIDSHDHSSGKGVPITPDGMNINSDLSFNEQNATDLRTARFTAQDAVLTDPADERCAYVVDADLYFNDGSGNQVRITQGGSVTGSSGTITGLPSGTASASFAGGTFTFESATNTPATMAVGPLVMGAATVSPFTVTLGASASQASNYALTWPVDAPAANQALVSDGSGNLTWTRGFLPLGSVIATFPNLSGAYSTAATTTADANGFVKCNGQTIADGTSPMNGAVVPNINNSVFIYGNTTAGTTGGSATSSALIAHTHGAGSFATSLSGTFASSTHTHTMGNHTHNIAHTHAWMTAASGAYRSTQSSVPASVPPFLATNWQTLTSGSYGGSGTTFVEITSSGSVGTWYTTGVIDPPSGSDGASAATGTPSTNTTASPSATASLSGSNSVTGTSASSGSGSSFSILPPYITAVYLMRVK